MNILKILTFLAKYRMKDSNGTSKQDAGQDKERDRNINDAENVFVLRNCIPQVS